MLPLKPAPDVVLMIRPPDPLPAFAIERQWSQACLVIWNVPLRCTAMTASKSSSVMDVIIRSRRIPALFTTASSRPKRCTASDTMRAHVDQSATEPFSAYASPPSAAISDTTWSAGSSSVDSPRTPTPGSTTTTRAP